jgi:alpha-methylacyl-CoA racemase
MTEAPRHPHLAARGTYAEAGAVVQPAPAPRFSGPGSVKPERLEPGQMTHVGQHTREILADFGFADAGSLLADGVVISAEETEGT